ncbi:hypothetical protein EZV62_008156 [Acer yangbiense]|uniref:Cytochrome P450 n=1 Tax=Acer yangbiense TaxID=1000413 RepID=A0A5C7ICK2_9ROSI|nr:hypothetical protein EZV62_008156 [Acer yangbiense]
MQIKLVDLQLPDHLMHPSPSKANNTMSCEFYIMLLLLITTTPYLFLFLMKRGQARRQVRPPGPNQLPLIGNLHQVGESPHKSLARLSNEYGPLMFLQLGWVPTIVISSADVARDIFRNHDLVFSGRPELYTANKLSYGGNNISFTTYNEYWRELRKIAIMELLCSKKVQSFHAVRNQEVELMTKFIARSSSQPINLSSLTLVLANNIVCRAIFGKKFDNAAGFDELMRQVQGLLGKTSIADFFPWMEWLNKFNGRNASMDRYFGELDKILDQEIHDHLHPERSKPENEDLIDVLLRIQKDSSAAISLTSEHIKAVPIDIFIAGTDTSSATLVWTMTELIRNPSVMRRAQDEIRQVVNGKEMVEEDQLPKLIYLKSVIKEALRLHPPAPLVPRETIQDCTVGGYKIPAKTRVIINIKSIGTDGKHWENPLEFRPERFLNSSIDFREPNFEMVPFGVGRRGCPGMNFAIPLLELALANLLYRFDWKLPPGMTSEDLDMEEALGLTMPKKTPLCLAATPAII